MGLGTQRDPKRLASNRKSSWQCHRRSRGQTQGRRKPDAEWKTRRRRRGKTMGPQHDAECKWPRETTKHDAECQWPRETTRLSNAERRGTTLSKVGGETRTRQSDAKWGRGPGGATRKRQ